MDKYTHKNQKEQSKKIRLYNIAIYPDCLLYTSDAADD